MIMSQLKSIINTVSDDGLLLQQIKECEVKEKWTPFEILSKLQELLPHAKSVRTIRQITAAFTRKLLSILDKHEVLGDAELSKEALKCVKTFWSLSSSKQNSLTTLQLFGKWEPALLEVITSLASIFIDLYITAYGTKENISLWSKRLFSWLNLDLPDRAIKVALLEVSGHCKIGAKVAGPLVKHVLQRKFDVDSNPDYLLHFLLVKKWQQVGNMSAVIKKSQSLTAPSGFIEWLQPSWKDANDYIPEDKSLQGAIVSQFLLDLDTDQVLESLTDVLQMKIFHHGGQDEPQMVDAFSYTPLFDVQKRGSDTDEIRSTNDAKLRTVLKLKKRTFNQIKGQDIASQITERSPVKKKQRTETEPSIQTNGKFEFMFSRAPSDFKESDNNLNKTKEVKKSMHDDVQSDDNDEEEEDCSEEEGEQDGNEEHGELKSGDEDTGSSESDQEESIEEEHMKKRNDCDDDQLTQKKRRTEWYSSNSSMGSNNLAATVLKQKNILISDPVSSSYFSDTNGTAMNGIQVFGAVSKTGDCKSKSSSNNNNIGEEEARMNDMTQVVYHVTRENNPINIPSQTWIKENETATKTSCIEEDIASKLSSIRKSTPSKSRTSSAQIAPDTPTRRSTRMRLHNMEAYSPIHKSNSTSSNMLKDWLRPPSVFDSSQSVNDDTDVYTKTKLSKKNEITKDDVFPGAPLKTYSKRERKLSEKMQSLITTSEVMQETPKKSKASPKVTSDQRRKSDVAGMSTPNFSLTSKSSASASKASAKKTSKETDNEERENLISVESDMDRIEKTPSLKRKSVSQTPKALLNKDTEVKKKPTPSPTVNRRKSLRSAKQ